MAERPYRAPLSQGMQDLLTITKQVALAPMWEKTGKMTWSIGLPEGVAAEFSELFPAFSQFVTQIDGKDALVVPPYVDEIPYGSIVLESLLRTSYLESHRG